MAKKEIIKPTEWYTLTDLLDKGILTAWRTSYRGVRGIVLRDMKNKNILKTMVEKNTNSKKYHFKGVNIIKFLKAVEDGKVTI